MAGLMCRLQTSTDSCVNIIHICIFNQHVMGLFLIHEAEKESEATPVSTESSLLFEGRGPENITRAVLNSGGIKAFSLAGRA